MSTDQCPAQIEPGSDPLRLCPASQQRPLVFAWWTKGRSYWMNASSSMDITWKINVGADAQPIRWKGHGYPGWPRRYWKFTETCLVVPAKHSAIKLGLQT